MRKWYQVALFNLAVVTLLGLILRYKINFHLPFLEHTNILHAHSHFAFNGWITFLLQLLIVDRFASNYHPRKTQWDNFFLISTVVNYAMIFTFAWKGYAGVSIFFSTVSLWLSYFFCFKIYASLSREIRKLASVKFIIGALFFLVLSSLGPYALAVFIATKTTHEYWNHNALYFFLHFQYNGWFILAILGLLVRKLEASLLFNSKDANRFFILIFGTCIPSYLLTVLWRDMPIGVIMVNVITVIVQGIALIFFKSLLITNSATVYRSLPVLCRWLYNTAVAALVLKIALQFFSAHPGIGQLAFAFRPIIIGYLHLIFLVLVTLFLLGELAENNVIPVMQPWGRWGLIIFSAGALLNEVLLAMQGSASIWYIYLPAINKTLFIVTIVMFAGASIIYHSSRLTAEAVEPLYREYK
jgi:hypothetical protein